MRNGQAQAGPLIFALDPYTQILLYEGLENTPLKFFLHAATGIGNPDHQFPVGRLRLLKIDGKGDRSVVREVHRVSDEIEQHLTETLDVDVEQRQFLGKFQTQNGIPFRRTDGENRQNFPAQFRQIRLFQQKIELSGLQFGKVQNIIDQIQQRSPGDMDGMQIFTAVAGDNGFILKKFTEPDHRIQRRPELMTHGGEEDALGPIGGLRLGQGRLQLFSRGIDLGDIESGLDDKNKLAVVAEHRLGRNDVVMSPVGEFLPDGFLFPDRLHDRTGGRTGDNAAPEIGTRRSQNLFFRPP